MARKRMAQAIQEALADEMARDPRVIVFGEDVEASMFGETAGLRDRFGPERVRNTPISEALISGMAVGAAAAGYRPVCHLMYGNFIYTGMDAIANQAAKLRYMTGGQITLPLVYMGVIGGGKSTAAQHSDCIYPALMNLGGLKVVVASDPADAKGLLKAAIRDDNPVVFLQAAGRSREQHAVPDEDYMLPLGKAAIKREGWDVTILAIGSLVKQALLAAQELATHGIEAEVIDPRTLFPLDEEAILASVRKTGRLVIVDEAHSTCGAASYISAIVAERAFTALKGPVRRLTVGDVAMPFSPPLEEALRPGKTGIVQAALAAMQRNADHPRPHQRGRVDQALS
jgi:pyruvate/2-oxoglutarate/acetoin dehydrogenase E1 component